MIVTSTKTITFPGLKWGIAKGEEKELPKDKKAAEAILAHHTISEVGEKSESQKTHEATQETAGKNKVEGTEKNTPKDK